MWPFRKKQKQLVPEKLDVYHFDVIDMNRKFPRVQYKLYINTKRISASYYNTDGQLKRYQQSIGINQLLQYESRNPELLNAMNSILNERTKKRSKFEGIKDYLYGLLILGVSIGLIIFAAKLLTK